MDPQILALINAIFLLTFVSLLVLAIGRIALRYWNYKQAKLPIPLLLKRDLIFFTGLAVPFLGIFVLRGTGVQASQEPWYPVWVIGSGSLAILGTLYWVYIEYFKIEK